MPDIESLELTKRYGSLTAVDAVSFTVEKGEIVGMLGPNGAGKTTTLEMLEGLRTPDAGRATVLGHDVRHEAARIKERIGVQLQATALPQLTRVREAIQLFASLYAQARDVDELLSEFSLTDKAQEYTDRLSGGQLQRLSIALALVNDPDLVFLDEPTTGLDPQARRNIWDVVEGIRARQKTVMLTTHYMEEAERLCDRVAVMDRGRVVAMDTPARLIADHAPGTTIEFDTPEQGAGSLAKLDGADGVATGRRTTITTRSPDRVLRALLDPAAPWAARADGAHGIGDLLVRQGTLEDVFIKLTGRSLRA